MIKKYRKKPIEIQAIQWTGGNLDEVRDFIGDSFLCYYKDKISIKTLEGNHVASMGNYIIRGIAGEFYPCREDIFEATYEAVNE